MTQSSQMVSVTNSASTTGSFHYGTFSSGQIIVPSGSSLILLTYYTADEDGTEKVAAQNGSGTAITSVVSASKSIRIPDALLGAAQVYVVGNATGEIKVILKR